MIPPEPDEGRSRPVEGALLLAGGVAAGQVIALAAAPLLTRIYSTESFGVLAAFSSIVLVLVAISSLRYEMAIPIATDSASAATLLVLSLILVAIAAVVTAAVWLVFGDWISFVLGIPTLASLGWAVAISVLAAGSYQGLMLWHVRLRGYRAIAATRVSQALAGTAAQVGLGAAGIGSGGLLIGDVIGRTAGLGVLLRAAASAIRNAGVTSASLMASAREHGALAGWLAAAALLNAAAFHAPFLLLPPIFGAAAAGMYFLAHRMLVVPVGLIGAGVGQVFFGEAARVRDDPERLREVTTRAAVTLLAVGWPIYGGVLIAGEPLFAAVFGPDWSEAGTFAQLLAPSLLLWSIASPMSTMLVVGRREAESVIYTSVELTVRVAAILLGAAAGSVLSSVLFLAISGVALNLVAIWRFLRPAGVRPLSLLRSAAGVAALNVPGLMLLWVVSSGKPSWWSVVVFAIVIAFGIASALALSSPRCRLMKRSAG